MANEAIARKRAPNQDDLTAERLKQFITYDPETGIFRWKARIGSDGRILKDIDGKVAGSINHWGYRQMYIDGKNRRACRLAWLYMTGEWPLVIDHINGDKADDRFANLREATHSQNTWNAGKLKHNTSGHKGIYWKKDHNSWLVQISVKRKPIIVGYFRIIADAIKARDEAYKRYHGEFAKID